ncbi:unnamed protein product [Rotaria magnacalcarata]|uniref:NAD(+) kinase n=4 Tax=Rotaria magnacalcarata TaxID=392030 RepID=A0A819BAF7_9BILA|nr:unnamed protein product [Rotaria magnacalcarata]CAF2229437.1 unnamed protein product [Rotaria magnacalcarata]CAF3770157.1 unnamed protein product [Rotaria magnacalcarata]CAF3798784.1 unnamed protein product [Rotaria magnacalcarata]
MNQNLKNGTSKSSASNQRRTQSVDGYSLPNLNNEFYGIDAKHSNGISSSGNHEMMKESDDDSECVPLPRINSRPIVKKCWRARSVFAPSPKCNFGPKGTLKKIKNDQELIIIQDPCTQRLHWISSPNNILVIRKPGQSTVVEFRILVVKLLKRRLNVFVETDDRTHLHITTDSDLQENIERCIPLDKKNDLCKIDLVICLGGDGTLLHASSLFQKSCPPVLSFSMGSLGFLTPFDFKFHENILNEVLSGKVAVLLRTRLNCTIIKEGSDNVLTSDTPDDSVRTNETNTSNNVGGMSHLALNEVVIDRGPNSYLSNLDLYINDKFITKVQGDGLILSTPTGSTAYGMAAGASMVHPNVPAMVICPICPHSLSFRPIVVPAGIELTVKVSQDSRLTAWLSVDGRNQHELHQYDSVKITTSVYPVPCICRFDQVGDWFQSLADILHWNIRKPQLNLDTDQEIQRDEQMQMQDDEKILNKTKEFSPLSNGESSTNELS